MKFIRKLPSENKEMSAKLIENGWSKLKEPSNLGITILYSLPISVILMILDFVWIIRTSPALREQLQTDFSFTLHINIFTIFYFGFIILFLLLHELLHGLFVPHFHNGEKTFWGLNGFFGFVYTEEQLSKRRFMVVSIMPLLILSFLLPVVLEALGYMNNFIIFLCILNAGGACVDLLNAFLISVQVPANGVIVNNGTATFYKR